MKVSSVIILLVIVGAVGVVALAYFDVVSIGPLNAKALKGGIKEGLQTAQGYTPAKTPTESMERFHTAINKRQYENAALYCTKPYGDALKLANDRASALGHAIDPVRDYGAEKELLNESTKHILFYLDPFPRNFKVGEVKKDPNSETKAVGRFLFAMPAPDLKVLNNDAIKSLDKKMLITVLAIPVVAASTGPNGIEILKEGAEWKLNVPIPPGWDAVLANYLEHAKSYTTSFEGIRPFIEQHTTKNAFEVEVLNKMRESDTK